MKIGLVCPYNISLRGGVQEHVKAVRAGLEARGHEALIITPQPRQMNGGDLTGVVMVGGGTDIRSPLHTTPQVSASVDTAALDELLEKEQFDVLHFHEPWVPVLSRQILTRSNVPNVATFHAKLPETLMSRTVAKVVTPYTKSVIKYLDELTAVSEAAAEYISSLTDDPVTIIPNGIDSKRFKVKKTVKREPTDRKVILYVGRLERRKGVRYLFRAYKLLTQRHDDLSLLIAGDGPDREKLEIMAEEMRLPNLSFLGHISEEEKMELLHSSDLFCSPAIFGESFGIVLIEAMACGLVTVAGNNSGYASVLKDLGALSLVNPHDSAEFANRLELMMYEPKLRDLWKQWARESVKQYSYDKIVPQYEALYKEAVKRHAERGQ